MCRNCIMSHELCWIQINQIEPLNTLKINLGIALFYIASRVYVLECTTSCIEINIPWIRMPFSQMFTIRVAHRSQKHLDIDKKLISFHLTFI